VVSATRRSVQRADAHREREIEGRLVVRELEVFDRDAAEAEQARGGLGPRSHARQRDRFARAV